MIILVIFILGYAAIAFEHSLKLNKAASALITGVLCWAVYTFQSPEAEPVTEALLHHLSEIAAILFFLMGAMTIVELIDSHHGFDFITGNIRTTSKQKLVLIVATLTFFLSALLDNLTTAIMMSSLCAKLLPDRKDRLWFAGIVIISANAGGAWSPLGDVTTTMLWIGGQITAMNIMKELFIPSLVACFLPVFLISWKFRGQQTQRPVIPERTATERRHGRIILFSGIGLLLFVPLFKTVTHLPPFMGMLLALGIIWIITTILHHTTENEVVEKYSVANALQKIDTPSILFFLGILLAVAALQSNGMLLQLADTLNGTLKNQYLIGTALGTLSSIVDNVPLVAASQGMYDLATYPTDHPFWEFLAFTTGTGGSMIIIGSAAGVAVMGIEQVSFGWYLKRIGWLAMLGFTAGIGVFLLQQQLH